MEINVGKTISTTEMRYQKTKKKANEIRSFYINLSLFCFFIPILIGINFYFVPEFHWFWFSLLGWGSGIVFHGLAAFDINPFMLNNWEERKMKQFMKEELEREKLNG